LKKKSPNFLKSSLKSLQGKKAKISATKLNLKAQNIYIKPLLKLRNTYNKRCFEAAYLGENVINLLQQKVAKNITIYLGYFTFSKNHNESPKVAQLVKICQIMSPCFDFTKKDQSAGKV
jgi:hypothetical protein